MKIAIAQLNYHIGDLESNVSKIIKAIDQANESGFDLIVFSELCTTGYPPKDLLDYPNFVAQVEDVVDQIAHASKGIAVLIGSPRRTGLEYGKHLFNSAYFIVDGEIEQIIDKQLLPTYDIFDEARYFESGSSSSIIEFKGKRLAIAICEDVWNAQNKLYKTNPVEELMGQNPDKLIILSASPFDYTKSDTRIDLLRSIAKENEVEIVYVNQVGAYTEILFDGGSLEINKEGEVVKQYPYFEEHWPEDKLVENKSGSKIAKIHDALVMGVRDYFHKMNFKKAVIGLSGGIDSAVIGVLAQRALGSENVFFVLMPSKYSSDHSISDAEELATNLNCAFTQIGIQNIVDSFESDLGDLFQGMPVDLTEENIQARTRGVLLMAISNKLGHILLNTSNKSEMSVGYSTLYGDMCGGIAALGDVYKTEIFELARYMNKDGEVLPENIITKPPSAELRPDQKDSDSLPDYPVLDEILRMFVDEQLTKQEIIAAGNEEALVERIVGMVNRTEYKRFQSPPVLKVSSKAFGTGRRMPLVAKYKV